MGFYNQFFLVIVSTHPRFNFFPEAREGIDPSYTLPLPCYTKCLTYCATHPRRIISSTNTYYCLTKNNKKKVPTRESIPGSHDLQSGELSIAPRSLITWDVFDIYIYIFYIYIVVQNRIPCCLTSNYMVLFYNFNVLYGWTVGLP